MARPSKPKALKIIEGNLGKRKISSENDVILSGRLVDLPVPSELSAEAKKMWKFIIREMPNELFKTVDMGELKIYCIAYDFHNQAYKEVQKQGMVVKSPVKGEPMQNPYLSIMNRQGEIMSKAAANLGFTPTAREKIKIPEKSDVNEFSELAKRA